MNTFGTLFRLTTFGESHGAALGGVVDGMPPGIEIDEAFIARELARRRPGQSALGTSRKEADSVELLSGIFEGRSTGTPIGFIVRNTDQRSGDYADLARVFRPSHADYTYYNKYGVRDPRGGGRTSARETVSRVVGGAFAKLVLRRYGIAVSAYTSQAGAVALEKTYKDCDLALAETNDVRCPDPAVAERMAAHIRQVKAEGDTVGGVVTGVITGLPVGLGEPVFDKFHATLGAAMLGINAVKGFEIGDGFALAAMRGSEANDVFVPGQDGRVHTATNHSGGVQGGLTNGEDVVFRVAFKPVPTLLRPQPTVDVAGQPAVVEPRGRHDACVVPRAVPIVEAMAAMTVLDFLLQQHARHLR
ncbi:MAG: chorismate synthase [Bacteroidaceae bacterium]|nr:chorismate synthase [Bacteroidaceae bacterium]